MVGFKNFSQHAVYMPVGVRGLRHKRAKRNNLTLMHLMPFLQNNHTDKYMDLLNYERNLYQNGVKLIAGVDEVGRGPLAGPMIVAAVILNLDKVFKLAEKYAKDDELTLKDAHRINDVSQQKNLDLESWQKYQKINDSKKVSEKHRNELNPFIRLEAVSFSIVQISNTDIDRVGISQATQGCFFQSIQKLKIKPDYVFTDTFPIKNLTKDCQSNIKHGDSLSISIAAASIIGKVYRDNLMRSLHEQYPEYGFDKHKGYGTKYHIEMLIKHGPCAIHRKSFSPVKEMLEN